MNNKSGKIILSIILIVVSYGFVIYKIIKFEELREIKFSEAFQSGNNLFLLTSVLILMLFNWSLETIKWKILIHKIENFSFISALKAVFSGITIGIFTPNRIGEIGGRIIFLDKGKRTYGLLATSLGSFAQLITTIINGLTAFALLLLLFPERTDVNSIFNKISAIIVSILLIVFIWLYFNFKLIKPVLLRFSFFKTREEQLNYFSETQFFLLFKALVLSLVRYGVFITQFFLLLLFFKIELSFIQAYISIGLIYLFASLIPTTTLVELGIRGSLSIFFIGMFSENILGIVLATTILWIINLAIPSVIGSVFLIKKNL